LVVPHPTQWNNAQALKIAIPRQATPRPDFTIPGAPLAFCTEDRKTYTG
jgi:hypothetical protein